jgi:hypothetical protein
MKLVKRDNDYCLYNESGETIAASWANVTGKKLSQSNCDEIFGVVDVEKLADELYNGHAMAVDWQLEKSGFKTGFNKAMELNKDKLFTEDQMRKAFELGHNGAADTYMLEKNEQEFEKIVQQPTEIEVEIEYMFSVEENDFILNSNYLTYYEAERLFQKKVPKLDSNGNLILRKL